MSRLAISLVFVVGLIFGFLSSAKSSENSDQIDRAWDAVIEADIAGDGVGWRQSLLTYIELLTTALATKEGGREEWLYRWQRGVALSELGNTELAVSDLDKALQTRPFGSKEMNDPLTIMVLADRAFALVQKGDVAEAFSQLDALVKRRPDAAPAWAILAKIHFGQNSLSQALGEADRAVELLNGLTNNTIRRPYFLIRGKIHRALGNADRANADFAIAKLK